jgi:hypothetical protein
MYGGHVATGNRAAIGVIRGQRRSAGSAATAGVGRVHLSASTAAAPPPCFPLSLSHVRTGARGPLARTAVADVVPVTSVTRPPDPAQMNMRFYQALMQDHLHRAC